MTRFAFMFLCLLTVSCGADAPADSPETTTTTTAPTTSPVPASAPKTLAPEVEMTEEDIVAAVRKVYEETELALKAGAMQKDSFSYLCDQQEGALVLYRTGSTIRLATHWTVFGDHAGESERIYFKEEAPVFYFKETSSWTFGGPGQEMEDGSLMPTTIDKLKEDRLYIHKGEVVRALTKAYEIKSWEDDVDPATIPNKPNPGAELPSWTYALLTSLTKDDKLNCEELEDLTY